MTDFDDAYWSQIPKLKNWRERLYIVGSVASIVGISPLVLEWGAINANVKLLVGFLYLASISTVSLAFNYKHARNKLATYAESVFFTHFTNHLVRDYLASRQRGVEVDLKELNTKLVNCICECFSLIAGRKCRAFIVGFEGHLTAPREMHVKVLAFDGVTGNATDRERVTEPTNIISNTPYESLLFGLSNCHRYYVCHNTKDAWRKGEFETPDFMVYGDPNKTWIPILNMAVIRKWKLTYRSIVVVPIRYFAEGDKWPSPDHRVSGHPKSTDDAPHPLPDVWGFLRIDCSKKQAFHPLYAPELAATFADALYILYSQLRNTTSTPTRDIVAPPLPSSAPPQGRSHARPGR